MLLCQLRISTTLLLLLLVCPGSAAEELPDLTGNIRVHDPSSILLHDGQYYLFSTGWGIHQKRSKDLQQWEQLTGALGRTEPPAWTRERVAGFRGRYWAPDVIRLKNGPLGERFFLYYSVSSFGKQTSGIGLTINPTLDPDSAAYRWVDQGPVIESQPGDPYNAIDPSILLASDGRLWMAFGSYWQGIYLIELSPETGMRRHPDQPAIRLAWAEMIEAATLIQREGWYYLFVNHGLCCRGIKSTYKILVGRSREVTGPYVDSQGKSLIEGGGDLVLGDQDRRIGPGHVAPVQSDDSQRFGFHFYDGAQRGQSKLGLARWQWSDDGWPKATSVQLSTPNAPDRRRRRPTTSP